MRRNKHMHDMTITYEKNGSTFKVSGVYIAGL
jgi:hypothetical protein